MLDKVQVGKYTLESLTTGMYSEPKIIFREYIQNSVDSLEMAVESGLMRKEDMRIDIIIDEENSHISIMDNGMGIPNADAKSTLMNVGNSKKRSANNRGFRGIGRLGGMSYCDRLIFTTSAVNEPIKTIISFDCKLLHKLLIPGQYENLSLSDVLQKVTTVEITSEEEMSHYFLVEMEEIDSFSNLLELKDVKNYISQVGPVPYREKHFIYASDLRNYMCEKGYNIEEFPVYISDNIHTPDLIYKPNKSCFHADRRSKASDDVTKMIYFDVCVGNELYALGWYGECNWLGTICEQELKGLRVRKGNILIGDNKTLNDIFNEPRFNGYVQGELFILTDKLIPNARRDDFERNEAYDELIKILKASLGTPISKKIREESKNRNDPSAKVFREIETTVSSAETMMLDGFNSTVDKDKLVEQLSDVSAKLNQTSVKTELKEKKKELQTKIKSTIEKARQSSNYKINRINTGIDKKSKKILKIITDILSSKLSPALANEIIEDIINALNGKQAS